MRASFCFVLGSVMAACAVREAPPGTTDVVSIDSQQTGETYEIEVFTPDALASLDGATAFYIFDGTENGPVVLDQFRQALDEGAEPAVLVLVPGSNRLDDFTPTPNERGTNGGGQAEFIAFLSDELAPLVETDGLGGDPERRVVFGHSLGGLLSGTLFYDHAFASRAGIASPSFWWDGGRFFAKLAEAPTNPGPIVVACGEREPLGMVPYTDDFSRQMRADYGIEVAYEVFSTDHQGAFEPSLGLAFQELL